MIRRKATYFVREARFSYKSHPHVLSKYEIIFVIVNFHYESFTTRSTKALFVLKPEKFYAILEQAK